MVDRTGEEERNPMMTGQERVTLRRLQDRYLELPAVKAAAPGLRCFDDPGAPTIGEAKSFLFPEWASRFRAEVDAHERRK